MGIVFTKLKEWFPPEENGKGKGKGKGKKSSKTSKANPDDDDDDESGGAIMVSPNVMKLITLSTQLLPTMHSTLCSLYSRLSHTFLWFVLDRSYLARVRL